MTRQVFISSVQKEFAAERRALRDFITGDALLRRFFHVFLFEDLPAKDRRADRAYLAEIAPSDIVLFLFGSEYGPPPGAAGLSPTEREFDRASDTDRPRLVFLKSDVGSRDARMQRLIARAEATLFRRRFASQPELTAGVYAALVDWLAEKKLIRVEPFDKAACIGATLTDIDATSLAAFVDRARESRGLAGAVGSKPQAVLTHLNLMAGKGPGHAAILLFGKAPQRFLPTSEVKCAHFHGTTATKPIPSYQVYKGTVFECIDQSVDFVLSKISKSVGTRAKSAAAPVDYEIPPEVIREAIVNAVAHRDYTSDGSVQVMLFADRLEIWNPGSLPPSLTLAMLRNPHGSFPRNPLLAEPLYLAKYIERMGTGTGDMIARCKKAGLSAPRFTVTDGFKVTIPRPPGAQRMASGAGGILAATPQGPRKDPAGTPQVVAVLSAATNPQSRAQLQATAGLVDREHFRRDYLEVLLSSGLLERTIPDKPTSSRQRYRLTAAGKAFLLKQAKRGQR